MRYPKEISVKVYQGLLYTRLRVLILRWEMTQVIFFPKIHFRQISQTIDMRLLVSSSMGHLQVKTTKQVG